MKKLSDEIKLYWRNKDSIKPTSISKFEQSKTDQSMKQQCDINYIVKQITPQHLALLNEKSSNYADVSNIPDLPTAMQLVMDTQDRFDLLPIDLKQAISNDWTRVPELFSDSKHTELLEKHGYIEALASKEKGSTKGSEATPPNETLPKETPTAS